MFNFPNDSVKSFSNASLNENKLFLTSKYFVCCTAFVNSLWRPAYSLNVKGFMEVPWIASINWYSGSTCSDNSYTPFLTGA